MTEQKRVLPPGAVHSRRAAFYLLLGFLASLMPMPFNLVALVPLAVAVWASVQCLRALGASGASKGMRLWSGIGLALTVVLFVIVAIPYAFYESTFDYQECQAGANTQAAQTACQTRFGESSDLLHRFMREG
ncbi:hypothetical protein [Luteipulveratus flavus]|uniref:DUF4190 domain-containing protein n=1 Tax=Luteipulveratus flavus TaxID=3031728 RepID=A0ABT6C772_9MICO|nr:hypothetical protein [Luteipulveratus sp. YIM 133296]MDF8263111.1 hypothetical protein [Luteipulveratus sp. YIM 133296]